MPSSANYIIKDIKTEKDKYLIEAEIECLSGVEDIKIHHKSGKCVIKYDDDVISESDIKKEIKKLGYRVEVDRSENEDEIESSGKKSKHVYFVEGMHCASCELTTEKNLLKRKEITKVDASVSKGQVEIEYKGKYPKAEELNKIFKNDGYVFHDRKLKNGGNSAVLAAGEGQIVLSKQKVNDLLVIVGASLLLIFGFVYLNKTGLSSIVNVSSSSSLPMFLGFGVMAGLSSCAALVGGIILSMSKQWNSLYAKGDSSAKKLQPHIMFNTGRIISYAVFGGLLGALGSVFQLSLTVNTILIILVSVLMLFLALQMLGVKRFQRFQIRAPKFITRYAVNEKNFSGRYMPFGMGALTFFLPCGFTITAQTLALASGSAVQGALIMLFFALGTLPILLFIGLSSIKFLKKPHLSNRFLKVAGVLVFFFALYNINSQFNVMGWTSLNDISVKSTNAVVAEDEDLPPIVNGKQILKMDALAYGYEPNRLKVRAGVPVVWEITDKGTSGCTNAVISRNLFSGEIPLTPGKVSTKEFTPEKPGVYKFSCWMGMVSGVIEVVDPAAKTASARAGNAVAERAVVEEAIIPSGASGSCGATNGGSCGCGAR